MQRRLIVLALFSVLLAGVASPVAASQRSAVSQHNQVSATHTRSHEAAFNKTRFLAHLAVAAFLVHYIYKKYKAGKLGPSHMGTDIKAATAGLLAYHEMQKANAITHASNGTGQGTQLLALLGPFVALLGDLPIMTSKLKHGDTSQISTVNNYENALQSTAGKNGFGYVDHKPSGFSGF